MMPLFGWNKYFSDTIIFIFHPGIILLYLEENLPIILSPSCQILSRPEPARVRARARASQSQSKIEPERPSQSMLEL